MTSSISNADVVRSLYDAFTRHDTDSVINVLASDFELTTATSLPWSKGEYHGREDALTFFGGMAGLVTDGHLQIEEMIEGGDHVVVNGREQATVTATGKPFDAMFTHSFTVRNGKIARLRGVVDTGAILAAWPTD
jgi:uncharacterized protein